jgi:flagellar assembly protein FliH
MSDPSKLTAWERWELASFDEPPEPEQPPEPEPLLETAAAEAEPMPEPEPEPPLKWPTAEEIEQIFLQAREDGYRKGIEEGREDGQKAGYEAGKEESRQEGLRFVQLAERLDQGMTNLEPQVADELLALSIELARAVVRSEISARPEHMLTVVREALAQLPHQHTSIFLNPDDAALLRTYMGDQLAHTGQRIHEDFNLKRGDCLIEAGGSQLDATVAMRWRRVLENLGIESAWHVPSEPPVQESKPDPGEDRDET